MNYGLFYYFFQYLAMYLLWRDLGPITICSAGMSLVILRPPVQHIGDYLYTKWRCVLILLVQTNFCLRITSVVQIKIC